MNDYIEGVDLSQYTTMNVTTEVYDKNGNILSDTSTGFVGFKLANKNGDWSGFADAYENRTGELSLAGYEGGDLYLVVQNMQASVGYIEVKSITLKAGEITNVKDGSSLKRAYGDMFGKVGNALVGNQMTDKNCVNFATSQYNSVTMGNEMKPESCIFRYKPGRICRYGEIHL